MKPPQSTQFFKVFYTSIYFPSLFPTPSLSPFLLIFFQRIFPRYKVHAPKFPKSNSSKIPLKIFEHSVNVCGQWQEWNNWYKKKTAWRKKKRSDEGEGAGDRDVTSHVILFIANGVKFYISLSANQQPANRKEGDPLIRM